MKIALHIPFFESAEVSTGLSMIEVGKKLGHEIEIFRYVQDIDNFCPDFVLVCQKSLPKLTKFPTYGYLFESMNYYHNRPSILSWDGYLAISIKNLSFAEDLCYASGKTPFKDIFYNTAHISLDENNQPFKTTVEALREPSLIYTGFNCDYRYLKLLHHLSKEKYFNLYGPAARWNKYPKLAYKGLLPFNHNGVIDAYRKAGVGLVLQSAYFTFEDATSNQIFEINSAGAVAITAHMSFTEKYYKDTVLYFDPFADQKEIYKQINNHMIWIKNNSEAALEMALKAQNIFQQQLSIEKLLDNVIKYHSEAIINSGYVISADTILPSIAVIIRTGGRNLENFKRTLNSLVAQSYNNVNPVIILYQKNDACLALIKEFEDKFRSIKIIEHISNLRSSSLWIGLNHIKKCGYEFFGILDDDDEYFPNHLTCSYNFLKDNNYDLMFSLVVHDDIKSQNNYEEIFDTRYIRTVPLHKSIEHMIGNACTNGFLSRVSLLDEKILQDPIMHTGEDSYLFLSLCQKTLPYFNARVLGLVHWGEEGEQSNFLDHSDRPYNINKIHNRFIGKRFANGELITQYIHSNNLHYPSYVTRMHNYPLLKKILHQENGIREIFLPYKFLIVRFISRPLRKIVRIFSRLYNMEL